MSSQARAGVGAPVCYIDTQGRAWALSGDSTALFVQLAPDGAAITLLNPNQAPVVPRVTVLSAPGRLVDVWAVDLRDPASNPPTIYLQLFNAVSVAGGDVPMVSAIPLCTSASYDFANSYFAVSVGLTVALSSTPLTYTALAASQEFSITARAVTL